MDTVNELLGAVNAFVDQELENARAQEEQQAENVVEQRAEPRPVVADVQADGRQAATEDVDDDDMDVVAQGQFARQQEAVPPPVVVIADGPNDGGDNEDAKDDSDDDDGQGDANAGMAEFYWRTVAAAEYRDIGMLSNDFVTVSSLFGNDNTCHPKAPCSILGVGLSRGPYIVAVCRRLLALVEHELLSQLTVEIPIKDGITFVDEDEAYEIFNVLRMILYLAYGVCIPYHPTTKDADLKTFLQTRMLYREGNKLHVPVRNANVQAVTDRTRFSAKLAFIYTGAVSPAHVVDADEDATGVHKRVLWVLRKVLPAGTRESMFTERIFPMVSEDGVAYEGSETLLVLAGLSYVFSREHAFRYEITRHPELYVSIPVDVKPEMPDVTADARKARPLPEIKNTYASVRSREGITTFRRRILRPEGQFGSYNVYLDDDYVAAAATPLVAELQALDTFVTSGFNAAPICAWLTSPLGPALNTFAMRALTMSATDVKQLASVLHEQFTNVQRVAFGYTSNDNLLD